MRIRGSSVGGKVSELTATAQAALFELNGRTHDCKGFLASAHGHKWCRESSITTHDAKMRQSRTSGSSSSSSASLPALEAALDAMLPRFCSLCNQDPRTNITVDSSRAALQALRYSFAEQAENQEHNDDETRRAMPQTPVRLLWHFVLFSLVATDVH